MTEKKTTTQFDGWTKCPQCHRLLHRNDTTETCGCCPYCDYHFLVPARTRIEQLVDRDSFEEKWSTILSRDPLQFHDSVPYTTRLKQAEKKSGEKEAIVTGQAQIHGHTIALGVMAFHYMGGSMGEVVGEKVTRIIEHSIEQRHPLVLVCSSGGARMQESVYALMQMAKTAIAFEKHSSQNIPSIAILTNPTTGGVTASFASLADITIAEPGALICFTGPRVIEQTIGQKLPPGAQKSEFLLEHGLIDRIVPRCALRTHLKELLDYAYA